MESCALADQIALGFVAWTSVRAGFVIATDARTEVHATCESDWGRS